LFKTNELTSTFYLTKKNIFNPDNLLIKKTESIFMSGLEIILINFFVWKWRGFISKK